MKDVLGSIRNAERAYVEGDRKKAIRHLEVALRIVREMGVLQRLPNWVQVGATVEWYGQKPGVFTVVDVNRKPRDWEFVGELMVTDGTIRRLHFHQAEGKRYWCRYRV